MTLNQIAKTGVCEFDCQWCELKPKCDEYNHRGNDNIEADQTEIRKQFALESLNMAIPFEVWAKNSRI